MSAMTTFFMSGGNDYESKVERDNTDLSSRYDGKYFTNKGPYNGSILPELGSHGDY